MRDIEKEFTFVSVIIPARNEEKYVKECLDSLLVQDYPYDKFEILVIDDHSNDDTSQIVKQISEKFPGKVILIQNDGVGVAMARKTGISHARGDIFVNFSSHAIAEKGFLELVCSTLLKLGENVGAVGCSFLPYENDGLLSRSIVIAMTSFFGGAGTSHHHLRNRRFVDGVAYAAYRKKAIVEIGGYPLGDDSELNILLRNRGYKIYLTPETRVFYRYKRAKIATFFRRMVDYGLSRIQDIRKYPGSFKVVHIFPSLSVLLFLCTFLAFLSFPQSLIAKALMIMVSIYIVSDLSFSIYNSFKSRELKMIPLLLIIYPLIHVGYGIGFIRGLFKTLKNKSNVPTKQKEFSSIVSAVSEGSSL